MIQGGMEVRSAPSGICIVSFSEADWPGLLDDPLELGVSISHSNEEHTFLDQAHL